MTRVVVVVDHDYDGATLTGGRVISAFADQPGIRIGVVYLTDVHGEDHMDPVACFRLEQDGMLDNRADDAVNHYQLPYSVEIV